MSYPNARECGIKHFQQSRGARGRLCAAAWAPPSSQAGPQRSELAVHRELEETKAQDIHRRAQQNLTAANCTAHSLYLSWRLATETTPNWRNEINSRIEGCFAAQCLLQRRRSTQEKECTGSQEKCQSYGEAEPIPLGTRMPFRIAQHACKTIRISRSRKVDQAQRREESISEQRFEYRRSPVEGSDNALCPQSVSPLFGSSETKTAAYLANNGQMQNWTSRTDCR